MWPDLRPIETAGRVSCVFWKVGGVFDYAVVDEVGDAIVKDVSPMKIIIFGSVARHEADDNSDIDMLVVMGTDAPRFRRTAPIEHALCDR